MLWQISKNGVRKRNDCINLKTMIEYPSNGNEMTNDCYKPPLEERLARLEGENIDTNNMFYELQIVIDFLKIRIQTLENFILGDGK